MIKNDDELLQQINMICEEDDNEVVVQSDDNNNMIPKQLVNEDIITSNTHNSKDKPEDLFNVSNIEYGGKGLDDDNPYNDMTC